MDLLRSQRRLRTFAAPRACLARRRLLGLAALAALAARPGRSLAQTTTSAAGTTPGIAPRQAFGVAGPPASPDAATAASRAQSFSNDRPGFVDSPPARVGLTLAAAGALGRRAVAAPRCKKLADCQGGRHGA
jgi:hypothetical protein